MNTRKTLAAATLAALPLVAGAMGSAPPRPAADTDQARPVAERTSGPRALYWAGVDVMTVAWVDFHAGVANRAFGYVLSR